jgi:hypothetical protein
LVAINPDVQTEGSEAIIPGENSEPDLPIQDEHPSIHPPATPNTTPTYPNISPNNGSSSQQSSSKQSWSGQIDSVTAWYISVLENMGIL